ncbi:WhiB family transcriptional regulator [Georgenia sp. SYP-B2076]|uniref:WhiB family transcriptional regulator n=1 Tax=Georgenia sp. SYP-B2076 TaxID=2495881 RepID=UPI00197AD70B
MFVRGAAQRSARQVCFACPVRTECLADALTSATEFGVWGGLTERERRALLRRHPGVRDWGSWLEQRDDDVEAAVSDGRRTLA